MGLIEKAARRLEEMQRAAGTAERRAPSAVRQFADAAAGEAAAVTMTPPSSTPPGVVSPAARVRRPKSPFISESPVRRSRQVAIDLAMLAANGYLTPDQSRSKLADEFRLVKRPLLANAKGQGSAPVRRGNLIMITSSLPGEGKTFVSVNLAMSIAMELDSTVLLVDGDVSRPAVLNRLGLSSSEPGLLDALTGVDVDLADLLLRTNVDRLSVLPSGKPNARATELLASEVTVRLLDDLAARYPDRVIVFDAPPLLVSTESRALATQVGQVVLVVEADRTGQAAVKQSASLLSEVPVVMTVLNKAQGPDESTRYGQYGLYGE